MSTATPKKTIRETLKDDELSRRAVAATKTEFDDPVSIVRQGNKLIVPDTVSPEQAVKLVQTWAAAEEKKVTVSEAMLGIPIDAANALQKAVMIELGYTDLRSTPGFFGPTPPAFFAVPTDHLGHTTDVYIGRMGLPGLEDAFLQTSDGGQELKIHIEVRQKNKHLARQLIDRARSILAEQSLYKGKAFAFDLDAKDDEDNKKPLIPTFWDIEKEQPLILNADAEAMLDATLWTPIRDRDILIANNIPRKRGILLNGMFGTGKTLAAYKTAQVAVENGWTFAYTKSISQLARAFEFVSKNYSPAILFCEDLDKAFEDPAQINAIQNTLDGIDSKNTEVIVVLTTNFLDQVPTGIVRPGRIDTIINFKLPDPESTEKLIRHYAKGVIREDEDLAQASMQIAGNIPAVVREVVERSKLFAIARTHSATISLTQHDLILAATGMKDHLAMLNRGMNAGIGMSPTALFGHAIGAEIGAAVSDSIEAIVEGRNSRKEDGSGRKLAKAN